jgi:tetratricopeptide (TPR) repeat protein
MRASVELKEDEKLAAEMAVAEGYAANDPRFVGHLEHLASCRLSEERYEDAISIYERAVQIRQKAKHPSRSDIAFALKNLGKAYHHAGKWDAAETTFENALLTLQNVRGVQYLLQTILESFLAMVTAAGFEERRKVLAEHVELAKKVQDEYLALTRIFRRRKWAAITKGGVLVLAWVMYLVTIHPRPWWLAASILGVGSGLYVVAMVYVGKGMLYKRAKENFDSLRWIGGTLFGETDESQSAAEES